MRPRYSDFLQSFPFILNLPPYFLKICILQSANTIRLTSIAQLHEIAVRKRDDIRETLTRDLET